MAAAAVAQPANRGLYEGLELLRRVDAHVDLSRGWLQLRLLVELGRRGGEASVAELAEALGVQRKAVLDSLRKMRHKGLVTQERGRVELTSKGLDLYRSLLQALGASSGVEPARRRTGGSIGYWNAYELASRLIRHIYLYDTILALAYAPGHMLSLESLASATRLSPRQLDEYLILYTRGDGPRLLQRTVKETGRGPLRRQRVYYRLTREGEKLLHRLPDYTRLRRSRAARLLARITRSLHPRLALKRLMMLVSAGSAAAMLIVAAAPYAAPLVLGAWLLAVTALALLVEQNY